jgi:uncharacterized membrane protein YfcA
MVGVEIGLRVAKRISGTYARLVLALILLAVSLQIGSSLLVEPQELYETVMRP